MKTAILFCIGASYIHTLKLQDGDLWLDEGAPFLQEPS